MELPSFFNKKANKGKCNNDIIAEFFVWDKADLKKAKENDEKSIGGSCRLCQKEIKANVDTKNFAFGINTKTWQRHLERFHRAETIELLEREGYLIRIKPRQRISIPANSTSTEYDHNEFCSRTGPCYVVYV